MEGVAQLDDVHGDFAKLSFYNYGSPHSSKRPHGPDLYDMTRSLSHHQEAGWRPVAAWNVLDGRNTIILLTKAPQ